MRSGVSFGTSLVLAWTATGVLASPKCMEDCTKVLIALPKETRVREQLVKKEAKKRDEVKTVFYVEYNGIKQRVDSRSGFFSIVTSKDAE